MFWHCVPWGQECRPVEHSSISRHSKQSSQSTGIRFISNLIPRVSAAFQGVQMAEGLVASCVAERENKLTALTMKNRQFFGFRQPSCLVLKCWNNPDKVVVSGKKIFTMHWIISNHTIAFIILQLSSSFAFTAIRSGSIDTAWVLRASSLLCFTFVFVCWFYRTVTQLCVIRLQGNKRTSFTALWIYFQLVNKFSNLQLQF